MSSKQQPLVEPFALQYKEDLVHVPHDAELDPPPRTCFKCHQPGHSVRRCKAKVDGELCFNCGRRWVKMSNCPRCHLAWKKHHGGGRGSDAHVNGEAVKDNGSVAGMSQAQSVESLETKCDDTDFFRGLKDLMDSIRHLSVETQDLVVKQAMLERREKLERCSGKAKPSKQQSRETPQACNGASNGAIKKQRSQRDRNEQDRPKESNRTKEQDDCTLTRGFPREDNRNNGRQQQHREQEQRSRQPSKNQAQNCDVDDDDDW